MSDRLAVTKTYKLYINGAFPRTESGRSMKSLDGEGKVFAHLCQASRKDLRGAVEAARKATAGWAGRDAYNRGQILYRMAEMLEGKRREFAEAIVATTGASGNSAEREVDASIDRLVSFAGWADKFSQVLGCHNPVAGPYYNFTVAEPTGVVAIVAPDEPSLLGLVTLAAPVLCAGGVVVALGSERYPVATSILGEVAATSDVPSGVLNLLTGVRAELIEHIANHRDIDAVHAANLPDEQSERLRLGAAENIKRVTTRSLRDEEWYDADRCQSPYWIEPFVEMKTIWHPAGI
ncbi:MAG: aldehyde dehydrogenase family protein [Phycisphaerales bacterium]